ncbi:hypothetical protein Tco_1428801 [Tanacetum coccineum]
MLMPHYKPYHQATIAILKRRRMKRDPEEDPAVLSCQCRDILIESHLMMTTDDDRLRSTVSILYHIHNGSLSTKAMHTEFAAALPSSSPTTEKWLSHLRYIRGLASRILERHPGHRQIGFVSGNDDKLLIKG